MGGGLVTRDTIDRWERLIAEGDRDAVVREFLIEIAGYDEAAIDELARSPIWELRRDVVPTVPRELRAEVAHRFDADELAKSRTPTLLLLGTESPAWAVRSVRAHSDAIPCAETRPLEGQGHGANVAAPELLAAELERFFCHS
jgi:pimeloyl-ACP methyl ester carboxylesterase